MIDHFGALTESPFLRWVDLQGEPAVVEIVSLESTELTVYGGIKKSFPLMSFRQLEGKIPVEKPMILNKTNTESIADIHGPRPSAWIGKSIVIFESTTLFKKRKLNCLRIRASKPKKQGRRISKPTTRPTGNASTELRDNYGSPNQ